MTTGLSPVPEAEGAAHAHAWLLRLLLDPGHREVQRDLRDASALHRRVMSLVPDGLGEAPRARAGALFRLDTDGVGPTVLLVQSRLAPDPSRLPAGYSRSAAVKDMRPMFEALRPGLAIRYRLLANTVRRCGPNSTAGKWKQVVPLHGEEADQWWATRAEAAGLNLHTLLPSPSDGLTSRHLPKGTTPPDGKQAPRRIPRATTLFEGSATVRDPEALRHALLHGVGRSKSYGCGLLSLAPNQV
ncbi:type I-E CRISPR-associated protein Cas6/Cse3/CasE [Streptomyces sp. ISL-99]|uniref:type I-E CRISPR-associated protein Cas6/Cse3/CasE n=1 Tax=Streptomyces sp. ISL-99 TaxID=2819193 RepID=UPI001BEC5B54|nr:type I-E CRISPR-associated protein Cas6/Cse3/CasE [Streptomyces sp. ISL-99]MBT2526313.1 type I-E CRISPR-associated protein Cas6/Cse3/CasE [Streptomyces sp. ISL-99]